MFAVASRPPSVAKRGRSGLFLEISDRLSDWTGTSPQTPPAVQGAARGLLFSGNGGGWRAPTSQAGGAAAGEIPCLNNGRVGRALAQRVARTR